MPTSMIKRYYDNLAEGRLLARKCVRCGAITFPPTSACMACGAFHQQDVELSGKGELLFLSHGMAPPPNPRFNELAPYAYGHIRLEEGVYVQAIVKGPSIDPESLRAIYEAGPTPVVASIQQVEDLHILAFELA